MPILLQVKMALFLKSNNSLSAQLVKFMPQNVKSAPITEQDIEKLFFTSFKWTSSHLENLFSRLAVVNHFCNGILFIPFQKMCTS